MNPLSQTRGSRQPTHLLQTPDTFVRTLMPGILRGMAVVHASPELGAAFLQYTVELESGGALAPATMQRFLYVLEGEATLTLHDHQDREVVLSTHDLRPGSYAYLPALDQQLLTATTAVRAAVIEKRYVDFPPLSAHPVQPPAGFVSHADDVAAIGLKGDARLLVQALLPEDPAFDFAVNLMAYEPEAALSQVEIHYMEHGLLMLEGEGPYRLGDTFHETRAGDFIWMAPYCPQWFQASAAGPAKYLIYKDFRRMPAL